MPPRSGAERVHDGINEAEEVTPPGVREFPIMADEAFVGLPGDIVRMVAPHTESDPVGLLLSAHTFFGNCTGRGPHYQVEGSATVRRRERGPARIAFFRSFVMSMTNGQGVACIPDCRPARA